MPNTPNQKAPLYASTYQTVGPFFSIGLGRLEAADLAPEGVPGQRIKITGCIFDGAGIPIPDALLEIWQADSQGKYVNSANSQPTTEKPVFTGYGRISTNESGCYEFITIQPGQVPAPDGAHKQAPHILVGLLMRGLLKRLTTRIYFPNHPANETDPILKLIPAERRNTLFLQPLSTQANEFRWDIHMQGPQETVFLEF
jgi:protocatechuate 3,4-dioxygenase alpha subunit